MAVVKSTEVTNRDNEPGLKRNVSLHGARARVIKGFYNFGTQTDVTTSDQLMLATLPALAKINEMRMRSDGNLAGATATVDVGLYDRAGVVHPGAGAVYASAIAASALNSAGNIGTDIAFNVRDVDKIEDRVWQDAGFAGDPLKNPGLGTQDFTLGLAVAVATLNAGILAWEIHYTVD